MYKFLVLIIRLAYKNISFLINRLNQDACLFESILMIIVDCIFARKEEI